MATVLKSSSFRGLNPAQIQEAIRSARASAAVISVADRIVELKRDIAEYEKSHEMTTADMLRRVCAGEVKEAGEIEQWLIKYNTLCVHEQSKAQ